MHPTIKVIIVIIRILLFRVRVFNLSIIYLRQLKPLLLHEISGVKLNNHNVSGLPRFSNRLDTNNFRELLLYLIHQSIDI